ncbi:actin-like protein ARP6 [Lentinula raphanica]|nr:actin-like protein ARP6 [Lentinula raphanica]
MPKTNVVVLDNGAGTIKAGIVPNDSTEEQSVKLVPNAIVRSKGDKATYFGHQIANCKDYSSLHYRLPFEKGFIVDWDAQKAIWDGIFSQEALGVDSTESSLILTEPYFNLPNIQEIYDQFVFEEYEFSSYHRCTQLIVMKAASLIPHGKLLGSPPPECMLVVDSGFSFTHVIPLINGNIVWSSIRRLDVGGKLLTNHLKELVSFRQWNMMEETYIMNHVKETCCYVSTDFKKDLESTRSDPDSPIVQKYILPDMSTRLNQSGLPSAIAESIASLLEDIQPMFWENISLIGGNTKFPGFRERLFAELRFLAPMDCEVGIYESDDPVTEAYSSAKEFATKPEFHGHCLTRAEYLECGSSGARRKFRDWKTKIPSKETTMKDDGPQVQNASQRPRYAPFPTTVDAEYTCKPDNT